MNKIYERENDEDGNKIHNPNSDEYEGWTCEYVLRTQCIKTIQDHVLAEIHEYKATTRKDNIYGLDESAKEILDDIVISMNAPFDIVMTHDSLDVLRKWSGAYNPEPKIYLDNMFDSLNEISGEFSLGIQPLWRNKKDKYIMIAPKIMDKYAKRSLMNFIRRN